MILKRIALGMLAGAALGATAKAADVDHVLLISIDGMHALDYINCASGVSGVNGGDPYCPHLAALRTTGINYLDASTSKPSDSFPGLMAIVSGGSPRSVGAFYDVAYDRSLDAPATTTGNGVAGSPNACTPGAAPTGTTTEFDEGIDLDQSKLNGGGTGDGGIASIDPHKLPRDPARGCAPVYPWNFVRTNTIFGVIHEAGGYTAWSDKHRLIRPSRVRATVAISTTITHRRSIQFRCLSGASSQAAPSAAARTCRIRPRSLLRTHGPTVS
jgi:hypothetical protein